MYSINITKPTPSGNQHHLQIKLPCDMNEENAINILRDTQDRYPAPAYGAELFNTKVDVEQIFPYPPAPVVNESLNWVWFEETVNSLKQYMCMNYIIREDPDSFGWVCLLNNEAIAQFSYLGSAQNYCKEHYEISTPESLAPPEPAIDWTDWNHIRVNDLLIYSLLNYEIKEQYPNTSYDWLCYRDGEEIGHFFSLTFAKSHCQIYHESR